MKKRSTGGLLILVVMFSILFGNVYAQDGGATPTKADTTLATVIDIVEAIDSSVHVDTPKTLGELADKYVALEQKIETAVREKDSSWKGILGIVGFGISVILSTAVFFLHKRYKSVKELLADLKK